MALARYESTTPVLGSLVTVFLSGTQVLATIYADPLLTPLGNPFFSDSLTGVFVFYADDGDAYDIQIGTTGTPTPPQPPTADVAFAQMAVVGGSAVVATSPADAMGFVAGANITLVADSASKRITISATGGGGGGGGITQLTGDVTAAGSGSVVATLANTTVTPGTYGDATHSARVSVDSKGRVTQVTEVPISGGGGGGGTVTNTGTLTANRLILGNGGVDVTAMGAGLTNQVLLGNTGGAPSFGAVANGALAAMSAGTVKANITGGAAVPTDVTYTALATAMDLISIDSPSQGDLIYGSAPGILSLLPKATSGYQVLTNQGTSNNPAYRPGVEITSIRIPLTDAQIKALPTTPITVVAAPGAGYRVKVLSATFQLSKTVAIYTGLNGTYSELKLSYGDNTGAYAATPVVDDVSTTPHMTSLTALLGTAPSDNIVDLLAPFIDTNGGWWTVQPEVGFSVATQDNKALVFCMDNSGSGNLGGGNSAQHAMLEVIYKIEALFL